MGRVAESTHPRRFPSSPRSRSGPTAKRFVLCNWSQVAEVNTTTGRVHRRITAPPGTSPSLLARRPTAVVVLARRPDDRVSTPALPKENKCSQRDSPGAFPTLGTMSAITVLLGGEFCCVRLTRRLAPALRCSQIFISWSHDPVAAVAEFV